MRASQLDRRAFGRRESFIHAFAKVPGRGTEPCVVREISGSGALIAFSGEFEVPDRFRLNIEAKGIDVTCEVRHRNSSELGVRFVDGGEAGARLLDAIGLAWSDLEDADHDADAGPSTPSSNLTATLVTVLTGDEVRRSLR